MLLSFIIIGKNEEKNLKRCISSIYKGIEALSLTEHEIIYVDSNSTDNSIEVAAGFSEVQIYRITGKSNAALGRNLGAKHATGNVLFFVDGDMEIYPDFLVRYWNHSTGSIDHDLLSGQLIDIIENEPHHRKMSKIFPGGTFLIKRNVWESVKGMRSRFKTGEESDLGLRLMNKGHYLHRSSEKMINHYTTAYFHTARLWKMMWSKNIFYNRAVMYRHHLFNKHMWKLMWRADKTMILLTIAIATTLVYWPIGAVLLAAYLVAVFMRVAGNKIYVSFLEMTGFYILSDILNVFHFFTFFPNDLEEKYEVVRAFKQNKTSPTSQGH